MICVKIELMSAVTLQTTEIGRMYIANDASKSIASGGNLGDYVVGVCRRGTDDVPRPVDPDGPAPTRAGEVRDYPRLDHNVWRLITRALLSAFPEERSARRRKDAPQLDESAMRGLQMMRYYGPLEVDSMPSSFCPEEVNDLRSAIEWLDAADRDDKEKNSK